MQQLVIAICGMAGAGKSECRTIFERAGFSYIHLGATEETLRRYGTTNEELERKVRNEIREQHGMGAMAIVALPTIKEMLAQHKNVVIDNMYSWSEYKIFRAEFGDKFISVAVHAAPTVRYSRLAVRTVRPLDHDTAVGRDYSEIEELEKGGPIAMADFHIVNSHDLTDLEAEVTKILDQIKTQQN
jgi:dephospho-CoA kinase